MLPGCGVTAKNCLKNVRFAMNLNKNCKICAQCLESGEKIFCKKSGECDEKNSIEKIKGNMEDNNNTGAVFLDLARALNSISHEIFPKKAENFSLSQSAILRLKCYLASRTQ